MRKKNGFTLIELLVTISIISVLIAILIPFATTIVDPFTRHPTLRMLSYICDAETREGVAKDPRSLAQRGAALTLVVRDRQRGEQLIAQLPKVLQIDAWDEEDDSWLQSTLRFIAREARELRPGGETVITHLADILIIQALRTWIDSAPEARQGWIAALRDKHVGRALAAIHRAPEKNWSVESLAREVGMSRSGFSARFTQLVGESAKRYLTQWRMQLARAQLQETSDPLMVLADRLGYAMHYTSSSAIMREIAALTPIYGGISHRRLDRESGLQWPCWKKTHPGTPLLHQKEFTRGNGKFHSVAYRPAAEAPSPDFPLLLTTGRVLEHFHTGSMSRRSEVLESLEPYGHIDMSPEDAEAMEFQENDFLRVTSPRGKVVVRVRIDRRVPCGLVFMAFHWREAPANMLTNAALDPAARIPEYKVGSIRIEKIDG